MRHLNSGELKLFNVATDYAEQNDLASKMPEKAAELDRIRAQYVKEVDGGTIEEVYAVTSRGSKNMYDTSWREFKK
jgi:hypothetical protein